MDIAAIVKDVLESPEAIKSLPGTVKDLRDTVATIERITAQPAIAELLSAIAKSIPPAKGDPV